MNKSLLPFFLLLVSFGYAQECYTLVWSDEFNGSELDRSKWNVRIGTGYPNVEWGWGNQEEQYYSDRPDNMEVSDGLLKIKSLGQSFSGNTYTSARIRSKGQFDFKYGRIEARIKIPSGAGLWPAFWLLPSDEVYGGWPRSGEIDIMENFGQNGFMTSAVHYQTNAGNHDYNVQSYGLSLNEYHIFSAVWDEDYIAFYMDWNWVGEERPGDIPGNWPFNEKFHLILNMAMGGDAGNIGATLPSEMEVDYVRVYQQTDHIEIQGPNEVFPQETATYHLPDNAGASYNWTVPAGAEILQGQGTHEVVVAWGDNAAEISCAVQNWSGDVNGASQSCGSGTYNKSVSVLTGNCDVHWLDFDRVNKMQPHESDGIGGIETWYFNNPGKNAVNGSSLVGQFGRAGDQQYDVMKLDFTEPINVSELRSGDNIFKMDVYTDASGTIPVTVEFVNRADNANGYPGGIHGLYSATITSTNAWQTLSFDYNDTPDWSVNSGDVDGINILFNTMSNTSNVYYFDNLRTEAPLGGEIEGPTVIDQPSETNVVTYLAPEQAFSTYDWSTGSNTTVVDGASSSALSATFENLSQYTEALEVTITNTMGCETSYDKTLLIKGSTGIDEWFSSGVQIFPNPVGNQLHLVNELGSELEYKVYSSRGTLLEQGTLGTQATLATDLWDSGVYQLQLIHPEHQATFQVVK